MTSLDLIMSTNNLNAVMKTREDIITSMCYTIRHDYGLGRPEDSPFDLPSGLTDREREALWNQMAQIFDNDIAPYMEFKT
jgi:hypothetical protein